MIFYLSVISFKIEERYKVYYHMFNTHMHRRVVTALECTVGMIGVFGVYLHEVAVTSSPKLGITSENQ